MILDELVSFSNLYGSNEELVLAGGGNTSAKDGNIMYIKGSGTSLAAITADGFVKMDREKLKTVFEKVYPDNDKEREALSLADIFLARTEGETKRPSVETTLHSLFPFRFVLHLHPALVNGLTCSKDGEKACKKLFGNEVLWIEPCKPGYILAKICEKSLKDYENENGKPCDKVLLANHGIFVAADTVAELGEKLGFVMDKIRAEVKEEPNLETGEFYPDDSDKVFSVLSSHFGEDFLVNFEPSAESIRLASSKETITPLMTPFNPDQIVYCKAFPIYAEKAEDLPALIGEYKEKNGFLPKVFLVKKCGLYTVDKTAKGAETAAMLFHDAAKIACYAKFFGGPRHMSDELTDFIVNWEAESYRSKQQ